MKERLWQILRHRKRWFWIGAAIIVLLPAAGALSLYWDSRDVDLLIVNGMVVDGSGDAPYRGDVAIRNGKIVGISRWRFLLASPRLRINAERKIVAPGFIDVHAHIESNLPQSEAFRPLNFLRQGVTTLITGNCGRSRIDIAEMLSGIDRRGAYLNVATLAGHNSIRKAVIGQAARQPSSIEMQRMERMVALDMEAGALGISTGLAYSPGRFAQRDELVTLARAAAERGGIYVSHIRNEAHGGEEALREALEIGRLADAPVHISHLKCSGRAQWYSMAQRLRLLDEARSSGQIVYFDAYPYDHSSTTTDVLLPDWAVEERRSGVRRASQDPPTRQRLHDEIMRRVRLDGWTDLSHVQLVAGRPEWIGRSLAEIPDASTTLDRQVENLIEVSLRGGAQAIYADMDEADVKQALTNPYCVFGSDSAVRDPENTYKPHPRGMGTFPRIFGRYVRETRSLDLRQAVRKASCLAAEIFGLEKRGRLTGGYWADIVVFDPETIRDTADYEQPFAEPVGIDYVIVNGVIAVDHGSLTDNRPAGAALRKPMGVLSP